MADDFLIARFGIGDWEVNNNLKKTWAHFSQEIPLVQPEIESCRSETAPVKHEIHGSAAHLSGPEKIQAILQMPEPKDVTALKRFLGMVTYLAKFQTPRRQECGVPVVATTLPRNKHNQEVPDGDTSSSLLWCKQANHCPMWCKPVWLRGWSPYSKMKFTSHPSVFSECGWPYKSTTLKCNARKVHSCILHMHWVGYSWRPLIECRRSCVRFIYLRQLIMKSIFKLNHRNKMFFMIKLQQMVIFRNLSVLSS